MPKENSNKPTVFFYDTIAFTSISASWHVFVRYETVNLIKKKIKQIEEHTLRFLVTRQQRNTFPCFVKPLKFRDFR